MKLANDLGWEGIKLDNLDSHRRRKQKIVEVVYITIKANQEPKSTILSKEKVWITKQIMNKKLSNQF